jgi:hypothetical protein
MQHYENYDMVHIFEEHSIVLRFNTKIITEYGILCHDLHYFCKRKNSATVMNC